MESFVAKLTRWAPTVLFITSAVVFVGDILGANMIASVTAQQANGAALSGAADTAMNLARSQLLMGVVGALQNAAWPFAAGALIRSIQSKPNI